MDCESRLRRSYVPSPTKVHQQQYQRDRYHYEEREEPVKHVNDFHFDQKEYLEKCAPEEKSVLSRPAKGGKFDIVPRKGVPNKPTMDRYDFEMTDKEISRKKMDDDLLRLQMERNKVILIIV